MNKRKFLDSNPIIVYIFLLLISWGVLNIILSLLQINIYHINKFSLGLDLRTFLNASKTILKGENPYYIPGFVTPPISATIFIPFVLIGEKLSILLFFFLNIGLVVVSLIYSYSIFFSLTSVKKELYATLLMLPFSFPFLFLIDRGNIDAIVLLLVIISIYTFDSKKYISPILLAVSVSLKIYPIILIVPLVLLKRWKFIFLFLISLFVLIAFYPELWFNYLDTNLINRVNQFRLDENVSSYNFLFILLSSIKYFYINSFRDNLKEINLFIVLFIFLYTLWVDFYQKKISGTAITKQILITYFPFMFLVPNLVYSYEHIALLCLLPFFLWFYQNNKRKKINKYIILGTISIVITNFPIISYQKILLRLNEFLNVNWLAKNIFIFPSFANLLLIITLIKLKRYLISKDISQNLE